MTDEQRDRAIEKIRAKRAFYQHLLVYVLVNLGLVAIWAFGSTGEEFWPIWPILGWGIGIVAHGVSVFAGTRPISEQQIQREIDRGV